MGRRRQWGSVRRLASGRYQARLPDGSPAPDTFSTRAEASRWLSLAEADVVRGTFVHPSLSANVTVAEARGMAHSALAAQATHHPRA
jgi:hypothetical protein